MMDAEVGDAAAGGEKLGVEFVADGDRDHFGAIPWMREVAFGIPGRQVKPVCIVFLRRIRNAAPAPGAPPYDDAAGEHLVEELAVDKGHGARAKGGGDFHELPAIQNWRHGLSSPHVPCAGDSNQKL